MCKAAHFWAWLEPPARLIQPPGDSAMAFPLVALLMAAARAIRLARMAGSLLNPGQGGGIVTIRAKVRGIPEMKAALRRLHGDLRRKLLRQALAEGARAVRDDARRTVPTLNASSVPVRKGYRTAGQVRKSIVVRTSKMARRAGDVGVFVNVRPAKRGQRGAKNPNDPFYWRWLEFGTKAMAARPFLRPAAGKLGEALRIIERRLGRDVQKYDKGV